MIENLCKHDEADSLPTEQLAAWYKALENIEMQIVRIMLIRRKYKGRRKSSSRRSVAIMISGVVMLTGWVFNDYAKWVTLSSIIVGLSVYFMIIKFLPISSNEKEQLIYLLKMARLPENSFVARLGVSAETSPEIIEEKMLAVIKKEKQHIKNLQELKLSSSK